ncbi:hypothetical protein [Marinomonas atlantica]|uniref:hypothetical protein n=1 Tax=Marinomonas atlantica TaxID=1806668 RepID=UPI00082E46FC|nr:hypothetical protein [Marinomonas atlantica]MCO4786771.1 hypothetical protein [Marinomonas atlantica]
MSDALVLWDARNSNRFLQRFIEDFKAELTRFSLKVRFVTLSNVTSLEEDQIKPSMRGLLDLIHVESPLHLITFGSKPNSLASLISPALRCKLHTNLLPEWLEGEPHHSTIAKLASYIHKNEEWGDGSELKDYFYPQFTSKAVNAIVFFKEDDFSNVIEEHAIAHNIAYQSISLKSFLPPAVQLLHKVGILVVSSNSANQGDIIELANGYGLPVLLISPEMRNFGIREGENGWVVSTTQQIQYTNYLKNWQCMSQNVREMISQYCRYSQSTQSGVRCYCSSLGYPEKLELKDFKLRG